MGDGARTRERVLETGLSMASEVGLGGLTIGKVARAVDLSKAGLYAHFDSKEDLLKSVLEAAVERFVEDGVTPALAAEAGTPRIRALFEAWLEWTRAPWLPGGCVFISSAVELDDRGGPLREYLVRTQSGWRALLRKSAEEARQVGDFAPEVDPDQFVFELYSVVLSFHYFHRLFRDDRAEERARASFEGLMERFRAPGGGP